MSLNLDTVHLVQRTHDAGRQQCGHAAQQGSHIHGLQFSTYPFICDVACSHGGKETSKVGKAVCETHEDSSKAWRDIQMVHLES